MNRLTGVGRFEQTLRKSRFIGACAPAASHAEANEFIEHGGEPDCRHVCWAFRCGDVVRFDDAGEPGGTAGRPILSSIEHFELDYSVVLVSRYFGGIKLGTGPLARAYAGTAMEAIAAAPMRPIIETIAMECQLPFEASDAVHRLIERLGGRKLDENWDAAGLTLQVSLPASQEAAFTAAVQQSTSGAGRARRRGR